MKADCGDVIIFKLTKRESLKMCVVLGYATGKIMDDLRETGEQDQAFLWEMLNTIDAFILSERKTQ